MTRIITIVIFILIIFSCQNEKPVKITEKNFRGKTFNIVFNTERDTAVIQFKDSTYQIFEQLWEGEIPWRISHFENSDFLILDNRVIGLSEKNNDSIIGTYLGLTDSKLKFAERKSKWDPDLIKGEWVNKKYNFNSSDSIPFPSPPPGVHNNSIWPPRYIITEDSIELLHAHSVSKSSYELNNTAEFLITDVYSPENMRQEWQWEIKELNEKNMIVRKRVADSGRTKFITDTLIKNGS